MNKIRAFFEQHREPVFYLIFGVLTTSVNYAVYLPCFNLLGMSAAVSNVLAWTAAVIFAYLTNKTFVFSSHDWSAGAVWPELMRFLAGRAFSGGLETGLLYVSVDLLRWNGNRMKLIAAIVVVIVNYIFGKFLVFANKRS